LLKEGQGVQGPDNSTSIFSLFLKTFLLAYVKLCIVR
jgi:hypothetical protein